MSLLRGIGFRALLCLLLLLLVPGIALAAGGETNQELIRILLGVAVILFFAKLSGHVAETVHMPAVLGELLAVAAKLDDLALIATIRACDEVLLHLEKTVYCTPPHARQGAADGHMAPGTGWVAGAVHAAVGAAAADSGEHRWLEDARGKLGRAVARAAWAISIYAGRIRASAAGQPLRQRP